MDRGFAGVVAVALLGCAVVLAIAFQISEGLAMEAERHGGGPGIESDVANALTDGTPERQPSLYVDSNPAIPSAGGRDEEIGAEHDDAATPPSALSGQDQAEELISTAPASGNMPSERKGTPTPVKEINPAEGHTVSPQPADEIEERARKGHLRQHGQTRIPNVTSNDPTSPASPVLENPEGTAGAEAAPGIEMIRGTRRSTEPIAASENED